MVAAKLLRQFKSVWFNVLFSHSLAHSTTSYFGVFSLRWSLAFCLRFVDGIWFYCVWLCNRDLLLMILTWQRVTSNGSIAMKLATGQVEQYTQIFTVWYLYRYACVRICFSALALPMQNLHCLRFKQRVLKEWKINWAFLWFSDFSWNFNPLLSIEDSNVHLHQITFSALATAQISKWECHTCCFSSISHISAYLYVLYKQHHLHVFTFICRCFWAPNHMKRKHNQMSSILINVNI